MKVYQHPIKRRQELDRQNVLGVGQFGDNIDRCTVDIVIPDKLKNSCVGIWWAIGDELIVYTDIVDGPDNAVEEGDRDGTYQLDYNKFHKDIWKSEGLDKRYGQSEYDYYPRGRVIYDTDEAVFDIYTSRRYAELQTAEFISEVADAFNIPRGSYNAVQFYKSSVDAYGNK